MEHLDMKIEVKKPPVWDEVHKHFEIDDERTVYTWGDTICNPANLSLNQELIDHESTHARQQIAIGGPEIWWGKYLIDSDFRLQQEAEAYSNQYISFCSRVKDRNRQAKYLWLLAETLSSPMYKVNVHLMDALKLIKSYI